MKKSKKKTKTQPEEQVQTQQARENHADFLRASFTRRLGALMYDALVAMAVYALAHFIGFIVVALLAQLNPSFCSDNTDIQRCIITSDVYSGYLIFAVCFFFIWFWTHGGQTLGMRAWRLKVQRMNGASITTLQAVIRLCTGFFGLGNIWLLSKKSEGMSLQDRMSGSEIVVLSPEANKIKNWHQL
ncbi:MAG: RDD family protein [Psychrobium sp.]